MLKRVTRGEAHLRGLAPGQHSYEETSQRWRVVGDIVSDLTGLGIARTAALKGRSLERYSSFIQTYPNRQAQTCIRKNEPNTEVSGNQRNRTCVPTCKLDQYC